MSALLVLETTVAPAGMETGVEVEDPTLAPVLSVMVARMLAVSTLLPLP